MTHAYDVVWADSLEKLVTLVNGYIEKGWEPTGGMTLHVNPKNFLSRMYYQPIIRKSDD